MKVSQPGHDLQLTQHANASDFARLVVPTMTAREAANCLQLGLISGMLKGHFQAPYLATVARHGRENEPLLNVIQTPPYRLILGEPSDAELSHTQLIQPLLEALPAGLPGVLGPVEFSKEFARQYARTHGVNYALVMAERVHQCHTVTMPDGVPGRMLRAEREHQRLLVDWWRAFQQEAVPNEPDRAESSVERDLNADTGGLYVWEVNGQAVSFAGARGPTPNGVRIGPVYTPPDQRRNGYAAALVGSLTQQLLQQGRRFVFLFTNLANPTANALYRRLGYEGVADRSMYDFTDPAA